MIGAAAAFRFDRMSEEQKKSLTTNWQELEVNTNLKLSNL